MRHEALFRDFVRRFSPAVGSSPVPTERLREPEVALASRLPRTYLTLMREAGGIFMAGILRAQVTLEEELS